MVKRSTFPLSSKIVIFVSSFTMETACRIASSVEEKITVSAEPSNRSVYSRRSESQESEILGGRDTRECSTTTHLLYIRIAPYDVMGGESFYESMIPGFTPP